LVVRAPTLPRHVGIILDGNRQYARRCDVTDPSAIYALGARKLDDVLDWCAEIDIPTVTPGEEVSGILAAIEAKISARAGCAHP
jgi:undecaprenyl pyrophosphate synthase